MQKGNLELNINGNYRDFFSVAPEQMKKILEQSLSKLGFLGDYGIDLSFVDEAEIQKLNREYRNIDKPTDILSFPQPLLNLDYNLLGSMVICGKIANERKEGIDQLLKHGILHLLGHDHDTNETDWDAAAKKIDCDF